MANSKDDDFDPKQAISELSASIQQPDRFAQIFCEAAKKQKAIDEVLKETFRNLIKNDPDTQNIIKGFIREVEKEDFKSWIKRVGRGLSYLFALIAGAVMQALLRKFSG